MKIKKDKESKLRNSEIGLQLLDGESSDSSVEKKPKKTSRNNISFSTPSSLPAQLLSKITEDRESRQTNREKLLQDSADRNEMRTLAAEKRQQSRDEERESREDARREQDREDRREEREDRKMEREHERRMKELEVRSKEADLATYKKNNNF